MGTRCPETWAWAELVPGGDCSEMGAAPSGDPRPAQLLQASVTLTLGLGAGTSVSRPLATLTAHIAQSLPVVD